MNRDEIKAAMAPGYYATHAAPEFQPRTPGVNPDGTTQGLAQFRAGATPQQSTEMNRLLDAQNTGGRRGDLGLPPGLAQQQRSGATTQDDLLDMYGRATGAGGKPPQAMNATRLTTEQQGYASAGGLPMDFSGYNPHPELPPGLASVYGDRSIYGDRPGRYEEGGRDAPRALTRQQLYTNPARRAQALNNPDDPMSKAYLPGMQQWDTEQALGQQQRAAQDAQTERARAIKEAGGVLPFEKSNLLRAQTKAVGDKSTQGQENADTRQQNADTLARGEKDRNDRELAKAAAAAGVHADTVAHWKAQDTAHLADKAQAEQDFQAKKKLLDDKITAGTATEKDRKDHQAVENFRYATDARRKDATTRIGDILAHMATLVNPATAATDAGKPNAYGSKPSAPGGPTRYEAAKAQLAEAQKERDGIDYYLKYQGYSPVPDPAKWPGPDGKVPAPAQAPTPSPGGQPAAADTSRSPGGGAPEGAVSPDGKWIVRNGKPVPNQ
jgi:hypothetical protein